jgi:iron-regulated transporter 1
VLQGGKPKLSNGTAPCAISIKGVNAKADLLRGGIDGVYKLSTCYQGRAMYVREKSPKGEDRVLWYNPQFGDWDISNGTKPDENDILMYGGDMEHAVVPLFVTGWHLGADLNSDPSGMGDEEYFPVEAKVACADGKVYEEPEHNAALEKAGPILTDEEIEAKYRLVYEKYGRRPEPNPTVNLSFIVLLVLIGLTTILAIPYLLVYQRDAKGKGYQPVATTSFAQIIQQSKKKQSGHIN